MGGGRRHGRHKEEDGAVAVIVALLLVIFFGFAAFAVDAGALYAERRQLQNGADAGALALAEDCGKGILECVTGQVTGAHYDVAEPYADANANDGAATVESIEIDHTENRVDVFTLVEDAGTGANLLTLWFAGVLGIPTSEVRASAAAVWGVVPSSLLAFPLSFCVEEWLDKTGQHGFGPPGGQPDGYHLFHKHPDGEGPCEDDDAYTGQAPGGFGWLKPDTQCRLFIPGVPDWYPADTGASLPANSWGQLCADMIRDKIIEMDADPSASPLLVPIFDDHKGQGSNAELHLIGFGAFRPTGYRFSGSHSYPPAPAKPCESPQNRCIRGWFTEFVTSAGGGGGGGGQNFGVTTVQLIQ